MRQIQIPTQENWWFGDGALHDGQPVQGREYRRAESIPEALFSRQPFQEVERPTPVYVSQNLQRYLREIVPVDKQTLFDVKNTEVDQTFKTEIQRAPSEGVRFDPNDHLDPTNSVLTDESFTQKPDELDENAAEMLEEVDAHLNYLRGRLGRLQSFDSDVVKQKIRNPERKPRQQLSAGKKSAKQARTPSVDVIKYSNEQAIQEIKDQFFAPSLYELQCVQKKQNLNLKIVPRQAGGSFTTMQKRNIAPPRSQARLMPRTPNRALVQQHCLNTTAQGTNPLSVKSLHPYDTAARAAKHIEIQDVHLDLGDGDYTQRRYQDREDALEELRRKREMNVRPLGMTSFASVPTNDGPVTEVKLEGKEEDDMLETTQRILQQLRTDESHLKEIMIDYQKEQNRAPTGAWYEEKSVTFAQEARQNRLQEALEDLATELNCPVAELMQIADPDVLLNLPPVAEKKDAGC